MHTTYSPDFLRRATAEEVEDGVEVRFWAYAGSDLYGTKLKLTKPPVGGVWKLLQRGVVDVPMHVAIDHAYEVLRG